MTERVRFSAEEARHVGEEIGIDWSSAPFDVEQFRQGMGVELEHGLHDLITNVTNSDPVVTGKIALAHLKEFPDYYTPARPHGGRSTAGQPEAVVLAASDNCASPAVPVPAIPVPKECREHE